MKTPVDSSNFHPDHRGSAPRFRPVRRLAWRRPGRPAALLPPSRTPRQDTAADPWIPAAAALRSARRSAAPLDADEWTGAMARHRLYLAHRQLRQLDEAESRAAGQRVLWAEAIIAASAAGTTTQ